MPNRLAILIDKLDRLDYDRSGDATPYPPLPELHSAMEALTEDDSTFNLGDGFELKLRIVSEDKQTESWTGFEYLNEGDTFGSVRWAGCNEEPKDGEIDAWQMPVQGGSKLFWTPPGPDVIGDEPWSAEQMAEELATIQRIIENGVYTVTLSIIETVTDVLGHSKKVKIASANLGGVDAFYPELISELAGEMWGELNDLLPATSPEPLKHGDQVMIPATVLYTFPDGDSPDTGPSMTVKVDGIRESYTVHVGMNA